MMNPVDHSSAPPGVLVGREIDSSPPRYYVLVQGESCANIAGRTVRQLLEGRADELELQLQSLRLVLASEDPEQAERYLFDGVDLAISQVVLRPRAERATIVSLTRRRLPRSKLE
jgi:hypothetical protein